MIKSKKTNNNVTAKMYDTLTRPVITEKSMIASEAGKVTFLVPLNATKDEVKAAVEAISAICYRLSTESNPFFICFFTFIICYKALPKRVKFIAFRCCHIYNSRHNIFMASCCIFQLIFTYSTAINY